MAETLYQKLQRATSEEDVKDIYIKAEKCLLQPVFKNPYTTLNINNKIFKYLLYSSRLFFALYFATSSHQCLTLLLVTLIFQLSDKVSLSKVSIAFFYRFFIFVYSSVNSRETQLFSFRISHKNLPTSRKRISYASIQYSLI